MHSAKAPGGRPSEGLTTKRPLPASSPDWVPREDLEAAIRAEVAAIHTLSQWGTGQCPAWVTTIVQAHCQIVAMLSDKLYRHHGVRWHHHRACPVGSLAAPATPHPPCSAERLRPPCRTCEKGQQ